MRAGLIYLVGFLAITSGAVLVGRVVESVALALVLAGIAGIGLAGVTQQTVEALDE